MTYVLSNGNDGSTAGSVGTPGTAKNVMRAGATESVRASGTDGCGVSNSGANNPNDIIGFSSRGPTSDGRMKPDVVAPGTHMTGAQPQTGASYNGDGVCNGVFPSGSTLYSLSSGTSHSAPVVAGMAALTRDWFTRTQGSPPSPALVKALILNTATDIAGGAGVTSLPSMSQGWGRANLATLVDG